MFCPSITLAANLYHGFHGPILSSYLKPFKTFINQHCNQQCKSLLQPTQFLIKINHFGPILPFSGSPASFVKGCTSFLLLEDDAGIEFKASLTAAAFRLKS